MEQRTLLAITLSLLVLLIYNSLFVRPPQRHPQGATKISQLPISKEDRTDIIAEQSKFTELSPTKSSGETVSKTPLEPEITQPLENKYVIVEISNIGGNIKSVYTRDDHQKIPVKNIGNIFGYESKIFRINDRRHNFIECVYTDDKVSIVKEYSFDNNLLTIKANIQKIGNMSSQDAIRIEALNIDSSYLKNSDMLTSDKSLFEYSVASNGQIFRKGNAFSFSQKENSHKESNVNWLGFRDKFLCAIVKPEFSTSAYSIITKDPNVLNISVAPILENFSASGKINLNFSAYFGQQNEEELKKIGKNFEEIVSFSNFSLIDFIAKFAIKTMGVVHKIVPNWGICIILICVIFYLATYPLTMKGMSAMRKMQVLQPKMAELREQYKNNPQRLNKEIMVLYKENKVNPLGGCFPFILQMPVFIGLYQALWRTVHLKGASFLWIKDLSHPDRLVVLQNKIPFVGNEINILPVIMAIIMFFQQKLSTKNIVTTDQNQIMQQKMMMIFFPIMLMVIFYKFSSGLTLYFTVFYALSTVTQWKMSKLVGIVK